MGNGIELLKAEVFAKLPEKFHRKPSHNRWLEENLRGAPRHSLLEGPSFDRAGNLYLADVPFGRIFLVDSRGTVSIVAEYDGEPNGLAIHRDGRIFVADFRNGVMRVDLTLGSVHPVCQSAPDGNFHGVNDLVFASNGDLYFTDQGQTGLHDPSGRVFRLTGDGNLKCIMGGIPSPNGIVFNGDESALYLAVTRDNAIWRLPFKLDGTVAKVGAFIRMSGGVGPDGLALNCEGGLAVAHMGMGCVWIFSALGEVRQRINAPSGLSVTNLAYGGKDLKHLYFVEAESGIIYRTVVDIAGNPMFSHSNQEAVDSQPLSYHPEPKISEHDGEA